MVIEAIFRHQQGGGVVFGVQNEDEDWVLQLGIFCMRQGMREFGSHVDGQLWGSRSWSQSRAISIGISRKVNACRWSS